MNSFSMCAFKTLPSVCRQCHPRILHTQAIRPFSSSPNTYKTKQEQSREIENQFLNQGSDQGSERSESAEAQASSPLAAITKMMQGVQPAKEGRHATERYNKMAESLEGNVLRNPYGDRAPPHHLHVYTHKHNTILTLTRPNGNPLMSMSCGQLGFRKANRSGFDPAYQLSAHAMGQIQERGYLPDIQRLEIVFRGFSKGRDAFVKVLLGNEGRNIRGRVCRVTDSTRLKFGGGRSKRTRRLG